VESDVGVRGLEPVELPFAHGREVGGQAVRRHKLVHRIRAIDVLHHSPSLAREH